MAIAKVVYKENAQATPQVWMDTTQKTVTAGSMLEGTTALKNDGTGITGNIASKSSSDLTASGATVTAPAGYYPNAASKAVASGTAGTPTATKGTVSNHSISVTPSVTNTTGYITGGTKNGTAVTVNVAELESGTKTITENGTGISVSGYSTVDVAVPSSGGGVTLITSQEFNVSTSSTTATGLGNITGIPAAYTNNAIIYVRVRDKAGKRQGYFYGTDSFFINNQTTGGFNKGIRQCATYTTNDTFTLQQSELTSGYGVYPTIIYTSSMAMYTRYDSTYTGTINGTYVVDVYSITTPDGNTPYNYTAVQV